MADIYDTKLVLKGIEGDPYGIKQMSYQVEKTLEGKVYFLGECIAEMDGVKEQF